MASMKVLCRLSSRLKPLPLKLNKKGSISVSVSADISLVKSTCHSQPSSFAGSFSRISQLPVELSSVESMMPLHSAIASARLRSCLSTESQCWGLTPQANDPNNCAYCYKFEKWSRESLRNLRGRTAEMQPLRNMRKHDNGVEAFQKRSISLPL